MIVELRSNSATGQCFPSRSSDENHSFVLWLAKAQRTRAAALDHALGMGATHLGTLSMGEDLRTIVDTLYFEDEASDAEELLFLKEKIAHEVPFRPDGE